MNPVRRLAEIEIQIERLKKESQEIKSRRIPILVLCRMESCVGNKYEGRYIINLSEDMKHVIQTTDDIESIVINKYGEVTNLTRTGGYNDYEGLYEDFNEVFGTIIQ